MERANGTDLTYSFFYKPINGQREGPAAFIQVMKKPLPNEMPNQEIGEAIEAFINKHAQNRSLITIDRDFAFEVLSFTKVSVNEDSLDWLDDSTTRFSGRAIVDQSDRISKIQSKAPVRFSGVAFFATDKMQDIILLKVSLDNIKFENETF